MSTEDVINPFQKPANDAPWWILPILAFICGVAITAAVLMPIVATPDYQRGSNEGLKIGSELRGKERDSVFTAGYQAGYSDHENGFPKKR